MVWVQSDIDEYALGRGTDEDIAFASRRLAKMDAAFNRKHRTSSRKFSAAHDKPLPPKPSLVVASLLRFDPVERPTMLDLLQSSLFEGKYFVHFSCFWFIVMSLLLLFGGGLTCGNVSRL